MDSGTERFLAFVRAGDRAGLEDLLAEHRGGCVAHAQKIVGNGPDADDAVQEAFMRLLRGADAYDGSVSFVAVLHRLVVEASLDLRRKATRRLRREAPIAARIESPAAVAAVAEEDTRRLRALVDELPEDFRVAIELRYFGGLSLKEAADRLGVSENLVAVRIHRGKERLRRQLEQAGILVGLGALDSQLSAAAPAGVATATVAGGAGTLGALWWSAIIALLIAALSAWPLRRVLRPPVVAAAPATAPVSTATASPPARPKKAYTWSFDQGVPLDIHLLNGSWHFLDHGGVDGSGCMETTFDGAMLVIDRPMLDGPLKMTMRQSPWRMSSANCRAIFGWWGATDYRYQLEDVGVPADLFDNHPERNNQTYRRIWSFLDGDALDEWDERGRTSLAFARCRERPSLTILLLGSQRIDDLRIEQVDPAEVPDVSVYRRAVFAVPTAQRQGRTVLPGVAGPDPARPVRVAWGR